MKITRDTHLQRCWVFLASPALLSRSINPSSTDWTSDLHQNTTTIIWIVLTPETTDGFKCNEVNSQAFAFNGYRIHHSNFECPKTLDSCNDVDSMTSHAVALICWRHCHDCQMKLLSRTFHRYSKCSANVDSERWLSPIGVLINCTHNNI